MNTMFSQVQLFQNSSSGGYRVVHVGHSGSSLPLLGLLDFILERTQLPLKLCLGLLDGAHQLSKLICHERAYL